jgi:hopanoid biosynthesis associated protein HpnK
LRRLIVTADDFGLAVEVNQAVEAAHRDGILTGASLMVGAPAVADAVARAKALPSLKVGLHVVLVDGRPVLPPTAVPDLVGPDGAFIDDMPRAGVNFFFRPAVRRQLAAEIRAQFERFAGFGLTLDHANAHRHFHLHPTVAGLIARIGRDYGLTAIRLPREPGAVLTRAEPGGPGRLAARLIGPWVALLRWRLRRAGMATNDHIFGITWTGAMTEARWLALLPHLPEGVSELYCHPATAAAPAFQRSMSTYRPVEEYRALVSPAVRAAIAAAGIDLTCFGALPPTR